MFIRSDCFAFASKIKTCTILKEICCQDCKFYKSKEQIKLEKKKRAEEYKLKHKIFKYSQKIKVTDQVIDQVEEEK